MEKRDFEQIKKFLQMAEEVCIDFETNYEFECPLCGGKAVTSKSRGSGRQYGNCKGCDVNFSMRS